jgi:glucarate dehydratase
MESTADRGTRPWDQRKVVRVFSAAEVACLDIIGKVTGKPIVDLLGGKMRDRVPFQPTFFTNMRGQEEN